MTPVELMQLGIVCASFFAAWKLESISRTLGEVTTQISFLKEEIIELKDSFREINQRVEKAEDDLRKIIKLEEHNHGK